MQDIIIRKPDQMTAQNPITAGTFENFIEYLDASPKTIDTYKKAVKQFALYLSAQGIAQPTRQDILNYREELKATGHKASTVQNYITAVRLLFSWTAQAGLYPNIAEKVKGAKVDKDHKKDYLTSNQVKAILQTISPASVRDYAIFVLMVTCGLRTIEVSRANIEDLRTVGNDTALYIQGKGKEEKSDFVKITAETEKALRAYLATREDAEPSDPLFISESHSSKGHRLTTRAISGIVKKHMKEAGYNSDKLTAHSLRHTAVTLSLLAGKDITEVQQFARHSNIATTMIYNHALDKAKNSCSEAITQAIFN